VDKLAHAYIFSGPDGIGKFTTAKQWSKMLLCKESVQSQRSNGVFFDSCGECESCRVFDGGAHPDLNSVHKELVQYTKKGKNKTTPLDLPIDVIREFLIDKVADRPTMSKRSVFVVNEAEKLNIASQNALLKVLEEPPKHCFIILICSRTERLLPTTLSRCQVIRFGPIDQERIVSHLTELGVAKKEATYWARFGEGSLGLALDWAQLQLKESSCYEIKTELIRKLSDHKLGDTIEFAEWLGKSSKMISKGWAEEQKNVSKKDITRRTQKGLLRMMTAAFGDAMKFSIGQDNNMINSDQKQQIEKLAEKDDIEKLAEKVAKTYEKARWVESNVNERLIFEELLLNHGDSGIISGSAV
jgi:DNA polymerase-3 subunit delta'